MMIYLQLFLSFLQIGLFSFGGGYAAMPLIQSQVVDQHHWLSIAEFTDLITISQMTPGPIAVNSATFVGIKIAGFGGAAVATVGCILPSCILVTGLAYIYLRYRKMTVLQGILGSVSYTHLDVYKRQGRIWQNGRIMRPVLISTIRSAWLWVH